MLHSLLWIWLMEISCVEQAVVDLWMEMGYVEEAVVGM